MSSNTAKPSQSTKTTTTTTTTTTTDYSNYRFVLNTSSKIIHPPTCGSVKNMSERNKQGSNATPEDLFEMGYESCGSCDPCEKPTSAAKENKNTTTVYVSNSGKIHKKATCSGMKNYTEMSYDDAIDAGYSLCKKCY